MEILSLAVGKFGRSASARKNKDWERMTDDSRCAEKFNKSQSNSCLPFLPFISAAPDVSRIDHIEFDDRSFKLSSSS